MVVSVEKNIPAERFVLVEGMLDIDVLSQQLSSVPAWEIIVDRLSDPRMGGISGYVGAMHELGRITTAKQVETFSRRLVDNTFDLVDAIGLYVYEPGERISSTFTQAFQRVARAFSLVVPDKEASMYLSSRLAQEQINVQQSLLTGLRDVVADDMALARVVSSVLVNNGTWYGRDLYNMFGPLNQAVGPDVLSEAIVQYGRALLTRWDQRAARALRNLFGFCEQFHDPYASEILLRLRTEIKKSRRRWLIPMDHAVTLINGRSPTSIIEALERLAANDQKKDLLVVASNLDALPLDADVRRQKRLFNTLINTGDRDMLGDVLVGGWGILTKNYSEPLKSHVKQLMKNHFKDVSDKGRADFFRRLPLVYFSDMQFLFRVAQMGLDDRNSAVRAAAFDGLNTALNAYAVRLAVEPGKRWKEFRNALIANMTSLHISKEQFARLYSASAIPSAAVYEAINDSLH